MIQPLSDALKDRILQYIVDGRQVSTIVEVEDVSKAAVYRIIQNMRTFGTHTAPRSTKRGRPSKMSPAARAGLKDYIDSKPRAYQDEMRHDLLDRFGVSISQATISKTLRAMKIKRKSLRRDAAEPSQVCSGAINQKRTRGEYTSECVDKKNES